MENTVKKLLPRSYNAFFGRFPQLRPAQEETIPLILAGSNVLLISPTGSGKTEAVVAPVTEQALDKPGELVCLYICPTRALVNDIERRIEAPLSKLHLRAGVRHGDRTLRAFLVQRHHYTQQMLNGVRHSPILDADQIQREGYPDSKKGP